ncbi:MAG: hypothetical protein AAF620_16725 [Bacteroidota bacterium]
MKRIFMLAVGILLIASCSEYESAKPDQDVDLSRAKAIWLDAQSKNGGGNNGRVVDQLTPLFEQYSQHLAHNDLPFLKIPVATQNRVVHQMEDVNTDLELGSYLLYVDNHDGENLYLVNVVLGEGNNFNNGLVTVHDLAGDYVVGYRFEDGEYLPVSEEREINQNGRSSGVECWYVDHYTCTVRVGPDDCELDYTTVHCEYYADKPPLIFGDGSGEGGGSGEGSSLINPVQCDDGYFADEQGRCINTCGPGMVYDENEGCILLECNNGYIPNINGECYCPSHAEEINGECLLKCIEGYRRDENNSCLQILDCTTDDDIINNIQSAFKEIWEASNAANVGVPMSDRSEEGGWIVENNGVYSYVPFPISWIRSSCGIDPPSTWTNDIPSNAVGWVHSHPFYIGEDRQSVCGTESVEESYVGGPSEFDWEALAAFSQQIGNFGMKAYVIDGNSISYVDVLRRLQSFNRCAY